MVQGRFRRKTSLAQLDLFELGPERRKSRHYMQKALQLVGRRAFCLGKRRERDSNPRYGYDPVKRFSKPSPSASRPSLLMHAQRPGGRTNTLLPRFGRVVHPSGGKILGLPSWSGPASVGSTTWSRANLSSAYQGSCRCSGG